MAEDTVFELVVIFILPENRIIVGAEDPSVRAAGIREALRAGDRLSASIIH